MAIEIILRDDISDYEPRPVFGFTWRQVGTLALCAGASWATYNLLVPFGLDYKLVGTIIMGICAVIALVGFARPKGLRVETYMMAALQDYLSPKTIEYETPIVKGATDKAHEQVRESLTRKERRAARRETEVEADA